MKSFVWVMVCWLLSCVCCPPAGALIVTLGQQEVDEALKQGRGRGDRVAEHINRSYAFGEDDGYGENGIIRTKWSKVMLLSGLLAASGRRPSGEELDSILASTDLQIDLHAFGGRMDFANYYTIQIIQSGKRIDPEKIAANDVAYNAQEGLAVSGFPRCIQDLPSQCRKVWIGISGATRLSCGPTTSYSSISGSGIGTTMVVDSVGG